MTPCLFFIYAPKERVKEWLDLGWEDQGPAPGHHREWSHVMKWTRDDNPPLPEREQGR